MQHRYGIYCGIRNRLRGKGAILYPAPGGWKAQFDDRTQREALGWHWFPHNAFKLDRRP